MSLFYGYKKPLIKIGGLPLTGGTMTGDIDIQDNHISTSVDPTQNSQLARKKYVDDHVSNTGGNFLSKSGGVMTGNIQMGNNNIFTNLNPTDGAHLSRKKYVDDQDDTKLSLSGGTMTGNLIMGSHKIITTTNPTHLTHIVRKKYVDDKIVAIKKDVSFSIFKDNFSLKFHNLFFIEYDSAYDLIFQRNGGKVKKLLDYGIEGNHFEQTTKTLQPSLCLESEKLENKYFLKFKDKRLISSSNLNSSSGKKDIVNVFIVYKLNSHYGSTLKSGLFGNDNGGWDKFLAFANSGDLIVSNDTNNFCVIGSGSYQGKFPIAAYKTKANAGTLNKWICLSCHWDNDTTPAGNNSSVFCNRKKLANFKSKVTSGSTQTALGDISTTTNTPLDGNIIFFSILKYKKMTDQEILFYHYVLCNMYNVDHDKIIL